jgi:hypothetical protein
MMEFETMLSSIWHLKINLGNPMAAPYMETFQGRNYNNFKSGDNNGSNLARIELMKRNVNMKGWKMGIDNSGSDDDRDGYTIHIDINRIGRKRMEGSLAEFNDKPDERITKRFKIDPEEEKKTENEERQQEKKEQTNLNVYECSNDSGNLIVGKITEDESEGDNIPPSAIVPFLNTPVDSESSIMLYPSSSSSSSSSDVSQNSLQPITDTTPFLLPVTSIMHQNPLGSALLIKKYYDKISPYEQLHDDDNQEKKIGIESDFVINTTNNNINNEDEKWMSCSSPVNDKSYSSTPSTSSQPLFVSPSSCKSPSPSLSTSPLLNTVDSTFSSPQSSSSPQPSSNSSSPHPFQSSTGLSIPLSFFTPSLNMKQYLTYDEESKMLASIQGL